MKRSFNRISIFAIALATLGCAAQRTAPAAPSPASEEAASGCDPAKDRQAILARAGSYDVEFAFAETEALTPGYQKHEAHRSFATELVIAIEEAPGRVSLQHLLQIGDASQATVIKHWRQDWIFQDTELLEFRGRDVWERRDVSSEAARCAWTQAVYGVDDAPRYEGLGRWHHDAGGSRWTSGETWRPLPRREYTTRADYDVLVAINEHRITQDGWEHEQHNEKLVLEPRHSLVREHGLNRYSRGQAADTAVAAAYWRKSATFWQELRAEWERVFRRAPRLQLQSERAGKRLHEVLFARAEAGTPIDDTTRAFIHETLEKYVVRAPQQPAPVTAP
jgi:hypothetical protein